MKKIISFLLSVLMALTCSVIKGQTFDLCGKKSVYQFASELKSMIKENDSYISDMRSSKSKSKSSDDLSEYASGRLIVKSSKPLNTEGTVSVIGGYRDLWIMQYSTPEEAKKADEYYSSISSVEYSEPDTIVELDLQDPENGIDFAEESTPYLCWGSYACGFDVANQYLGSFENLYEVKVGVMDTGIDLEHPFLKGRLIDEGRNFSTSGDDTCQSDDLSSHGTHVTGIIVDNTPIEVKIKGYKIFNSEDTTSASIVSLAIDAAVADGMQILNMSFGGYRDKQIVLDSLERAYENGVTLISAAGNSKALIDFLPAAYKNGITVGALDYNYSVASFSNYGDSVDILAPGVRIYSTLNQNSFGNKSGTSMATPYVVAGAALLLCKDSSLSPSQIEKVLKDSADNWFSNPKLSGAGLLNISRAIGAPAAQEATVNYESGIYNYQISVKFETPDNTDVYYTLNNTAPVIANPDCIKYKGPITIQQTTRLKWCTCSNHSGVFRSRISFREFRFFYDEPESLFTVSNEGVLTSYMGSNKDIQVPEKINGILVRAVGSETFSYDNASELTSVFFPPSVEIIMERAFFKNKKLLFVSAPGVQLIDREAFYNCTALEEIETPNLKRIEADSFKNAKLLEKIELRNVEYVGEGAFWGNQMLFEINMDSLTSLGERCFGQTMIERAFFPVLESFCADDLSSTSSAFIYNQSLTEVLMPNLLTLGAAEFKTDGAFSECSRLRKVYMPKLEKITVGAFYKCTDLNDVCFDSVEVIERDAFYGCLLFESVVFPEVKRIENDAFMACNVTGKLSLPSAEIISSNAFDGSLINCIVLGNIFKLRSLPWNDCSLIIGSTMNSVDYYGSINQYHYTVYGTTGTFVEEWASSEHSQYITEFIPIPALLNNIPDSVCPGETITIDAVGFNLEYQWFGVNEDGSQENLNANNNFYCPSYNDDYSECYCRITSNDHGIISTTETKRILIESVNADYSTLDEILAIIPEDLGIYTDETVSALNDIINSIDRNLDISNQAKVDGYVEAIRNAIDNLQLKTFTVTFFADEQYKFDYSLIYGETIIEPNEPYKNGYAFKGWTPEIPETMPAYDLNFYAVFEENGLAAPSVGINNYVNSRTVDYKTTTVFTAITKDMPDNATIYWYIDGEKAGEGERITIEKATDAFNVQAKVIDASGKIISTSETELIKVKNDFFSRVIAFFRMLFGKLPIVEQ